jgi:FHS family Na+ dependent glucose MFS transporter 1
MNLRLPALTRRTAEDHSKKIATTTGYYIAFIGLGLVTASMGPTLPDLAANTHSRLNQISLLFTARSAGYFLGSLSSGRLMDRFPGHPIMAAMLMVMSLLVATIPFFSVLWVLALTMLLIGFTEGIIDVGSNTTIVWLHGPKIGPYMNGLHFFFGVGAFFAPLIVAQTIAITHSTLAAYWYFAILIFPTAFWLLFLPSPAGASKSAEPSKTNPHPWLVFLIALLLFLYAGLEGGFGGWVFTFTREMKIADPARAAYLTSVFWGAFTVGRLLGIPLAFRFKPVRILLIDYLGCAVGIGMIWFGSHSYPMVLAGAALFGLTIASIFPTALSLAGRNLRITGKVTSYFFVGASTGSMSLPWIMGQVFEIYGPQAIIYSIIVWLLLSFAVFGALRIYTSKIIS